METPGSVLQTERKKQKRSLEDIAKALKIKNEYLGAIENDEYRLLPAEIFTKSYIRSYAEALDLDSEYVLGLYTALVHPVQHEEEPVTEKVTEKKNYRPAAYVFVLLLVTALIFLFVFRENNSRNPSSDTAHKAEESEARETTAGETHNESTVIKEEKTTDSQKYAVADTTGMKADRYRETKNANTLTSGTGNKLHTEDAHETVTPTTEKTEAVPANKKTETDGVIKTETEKAEEAEAGAPISGKKHLKVTATELTWVSVSIDNGRPREWLLRKGETLTLTADEKFVVKTGNAGGTRLFLNERAVGELGPPGKVAEKVLP